MKKQKKYLEIASHYENCLIKHGDSHLGVDWPREHDIDTRHSVMFDLIRFCPNPLPKKIKLLDFGCGLSHMYDYLVRHNLQKNIEYSGLDISREFVKKSRKKYPANKYYCTDILAPGAKLPKFDFIVLNGVFTQKRNLKNEEMFSFLKEAVGYLFERTNHGIALNVMSGHVDFKRQAAFHLGFDKLSDFLCRDVSRNFIHRHNYGLYEYTTYIYREKASSSP